MHACPACVEGCARLYKDKPLCKVCREWFDAPFGITYNRLAAVKAIVEKRGIELHAGKVRPKPTHKLTTFPYMRVRDRVGMNSATPAALLDVCKAHVTPRRDPLTRGYRSGEGWE